ncbi:hypothetical protein FHG87_016185 [Trinorchestia longiramus]|nr:hypothetical protein FHG87_016185 [Trinorchestia longiramus]
MCMEWLRVAPEELVWMTLVHRRKTLGCHPVVCAFVLEGIEDHYKGPSQTLALDLSLSLSLFDEICRRQKDSDEWNEYNIVLLHKGGHKNMKELNCKPIAPADTVSTIFCGILNERMKHVVEEQRVMG